MKSENIKPLKILHILDWYKPIGGAEKLMFDTLELLEERQYTNIMVFHDYSGQQIGGKRPEYSMRFLEVNHYDVTLIEYVGLLMLKQRINRIIKKEKPDICHIHNCQNPVLIKHLIKKLPCVRSLHDPRLYCFTQWRLLPDKSICPHPLGAECLKNGCITNGKEPVTYHDHIAHRVYKNFLVHRDISTLIVESNAQKECVIQNGYQDDQVELLPNFTPVRSEKDVNESLARNYNGDEKIALFVGRASYEKGASVLIKAAEIIKSDCRVILITAGPELDSYKKMVAEKGLSDKVEIIGGLSYEETATYYDRATVVIVPSVWIENFCLVGIEAFSHMKPVIGSNIGGIKDWLVDGETGYFFEPGNFEELASKIDQMISNHKLTEEMGKSAYRRVSENYNKELYISRLINIYQKGIDKWRSTKRLS